jgi:prolyl-tRNA synthetase
VIVPIYKKTNKKEIIKKANKVSQFLSKHGMRCYLDENDEITVGEKFYLWEIKGVPIRIELGEKELASKMLTVFRRDTKTKTLVKSRDILPYVTSLLHREIPNTLSQKVGRFYDSKVKCFDKIESALKWIKNNGVAKINWCEEKECYDRIASLEQGIESTGTLEDESSPGHCLICGKKTQKLTLLGRGY